MAESLFNALRREKNLTHVRVAEILNVSLPTVARWASGAGDMSEAQWVALLTALGLPLDWQPRRKPTIH